MSARAGLPVTIVGGFLGAGKTTLLNRILAAEPGSRTAVVVNDFGSIAFDEELAVAATTHRRLLSNGCVCCSIRDDLTTTIAELVALDPPVEAIVIEASGVADPRSLAATLTGAGFVPPPVVRAIVTVVDAAQIREQERDYGGELVLAQLRAASVVVLNKCDLVAEDARTEIRAWLREVDVTAAVVEARHCDVSLALVTGRGAPPRSDRSAASPPEHAAELRFDEWSLDGAQRFDEDGLRRLFAQLPDAITRAKGVVELRDGGRLLVQFVGGRLDLSPLDDSRAGDVGSRIVVIGARGAVDADALRRLFEDHAA